VLHSTLVGRGGIDDPLTENRSPACEVPYRVLVLNNNGVLDLESLRRRGTQILALYTVIRQGGIGQCRLPNLSFSCRNHQMHNCEYIQLYSCIYYIGMFRPLLCPSLGCRTVNVQAIGSDYIKCVRKIFKDS
jgi:hypothetical protein